MVWVVSRFRLKAPPGISSSCISPLTSSGQRSRAPWASHPQKSATLSPQPGGKPRKFIRTCGGIGEKKRQAGAYFAYQRKMTGNLRNMFFSYFDLIYGDCCVRSREVEVDYFDSNLSGDCQVWKKIRMYSFWFVFNKISRTVISYLYPFSLNKMRTLQLSKICTKVSYMLYFKPRQTKSVKEEQYLMLWTKRYRHGKKYFCLREI